jgi:hypothetical protein
MTAKEKVKAKYPKAYAAQDIDGFWHIWCPTVRGALSGGPHKDTRSAARAWKLAAEIQVPNVMCTPNGVDTTKQGSYTPKEDKK